MPVSLKARVTKSSHPDESTQPARARAVTWAVALGDVLDPGRALTDERKDGLQVGDGEPAEADEDPLDEEGAHEAPSGRTSLA